MSEINIKPNENTFVEVSVNKYFYAVKEISKTLVNDLNIEGVYLTLTRPAKSMIARLGKDINIDKIIFIDCVTYMSEGPPSKMEKIIFLESPTMLESILSKIQISIGKITTNDKFVFVDSISAFSIYNNEKILTEFLHLFVNNLSGKNIATILLSIENQTPKNIDTMLRMLADNIIEILG